MNDLLIKNAKLVTGDSVNVFVKKKKIVEICCHNERLYGGEVVRTIDLKGEKYLSAGWIDSHVHCYEKMTLYYDYPDEVGYKTGVTTVVDAGSTGADNVGDFYRLAQKAKTNVYALLNISRTGIVEQNELADLSLIDSKRIKNSFYQYGSFLIGLKARVSASVVGTNDIIPLEMAKDIQKEVNHVPLMVHIGSAPPTLKAILQRLETGDIVTHCFNGKENGILSSNQEIKQFALDAYHKGIVFDIGHGTDSFNFNVAEIARKRGIKATTISTDIYHRNRENGPVYTMATTIEKLYLVGYTLEELIDKVTIQPANYLKLPGKGKLEIGYDADFTIFDIREEEEELVDSNGNKRTSQIKLIPEMAVIGGDVYEI